jgi:hypothetical protein
MNISPSPEFLAACRKLLGNDSPETIIAVLQSHDQELFDQLRRALAELVDARHHR